MLSPLPIHLSLAWTIMELQVVLQAISSLAIAGGFLYTAIQFSRGRAAQKYANFARLVEQQMHLREMRVSDPSLASVYRHDVVTGQTDEEVRQYFFNLMQLSVFEIVWYGWKHNQIPEDYFRSWETRIRQIAAEKSFQTMWSSPGMKIMHDEFAAYIAELVRGVALSQSRKE